jgi:cytoskeletal protein RodZ
MQSENFDKKIKDSLSQRPPGNDTPEWEKMEALLDKHMPAEKKDRRRIFFILFTFLLLGGSAFLIWQNSISNKNKKEITEIKSPKQNTETTENNKPGNSSIDKEKTSSELPNNTDDQPVSSQKFIPIPQTGESIGQNLPGKKPEIDAAVAKTGKNKKANNPVDKKTDAANQTIDELVKNTEPERALIENLTKTDPVIAEKQEQAKEPEVKQQIAENKNSEQKEEIKETKPVAVEKTNDNKKKNKSSFANNFFVTVSAGPDLSAVGGNAGELKLGYGAGVGYQISKKFSVRTGFYAGRKVYTADPDDYYPPANFWAYYPNLKNINANCKVYEIPVSVDYKISNSKKGSWFVSAGVSSLLMKKETYDYYFKPNYSPTYVTYTKTINNQNKHYFSVLNLSGGYTRVLNKNISLQAEPYFKIAMTGVGYGKVKLNSGGVLFSAIIKPFAKK